MKMLFVSDAGVR